MVGALSLTPVKPMPSSSSSAKIPGIVGGIIGGSVAIILAIFIILCKHCKSNVQSDQWSAEPQQSDQAAIGSGLHVVPFVNIPMAGGTSTNRHQEKTQTVQEQLNQATSNTNSDSSDSSLTPLSEESPLVLELRQQIQELTELVSPAPGYEES